MEKELRSLKEWRILKVKSVQELSQDTGISTQSLTILENNVQTFKNAKTEVVIEIARALGVQPENFLELAPTKLE